MLPVMRGSSPAVRAFSDSVPNSIEENADKVDRLPEIAWKMHLNSHAISLKEFSVSLKDALRLGNLGIRMWRHVKKEKLEGRVPIIDPFSRDSKPLGCHGVPLGGMGGCSIGRGFRGEFRRWQFITGVSDDTPILADQFSAFVVRGKGTSSERKLSSVLYPGRPSELKGKERHWGIGAWDWRLDGSSSVYHALFPRAWTVYPGEPDPSLSITCRQVSPFIPHDYSTSSLPCSAFVYTLHNHGLDEAEVCLLFTFANSIGGASMLEGSHHNSQFSEADGVKGVLLHHKSVHLRSPLTLAMAARSTEGVEVTVCPRFSITGGGGGLTARDMWAHVKQHNKFVSSESPEASRTPSLLGTAIAGAVAATVVVPPGAVREVHFSLAWDNPLVKFNQHRSYYRRYTQFYGRDGFAAPKLAHAALTGFPEWEARIEVWQRPVLSDLTLPAWYRCTLFNELYYLVAGGTVWTDGSPCLEQESGNEEEASSPSPVPSTSNAKENGESSPGLSGANGTSLLKPGEENVGQFLYLEGLEYVMWNTYDVHFYASFALLSLFPLLELSIQRDFAAGTLASQAERVRFLMDNSEGARSVPGSVPHDLGNHDPWIVLNSYNIHDTSHWRDLNSKFVLQVYRDIVATGDLKFAAATWPAVWSALEFLTQFDADGDGVIENSGSADQTYDTWPVSGCSAYCGGLWLAALQAGASHASLLEDPACQQQASKLLDMLSRGREAYVAKLWNGKYFNYDSGSSPSSTSIQADQMAGQWYTRACGLPSLFPPAMAKTALSTIFQHNVLQLKYGRMGAVNGISLSGRVDDTSMQSREVWTGTTYALAAAMLHEGMHTEAFMTARGIFQTAWIDQGYWFQTPEAWNVKGHFRSLAYMRPLAIWAMHWCLSRERGSGDEGASDKMSQNGQEKLFI